MMQRPTILIAENDAVLRALYAKKFGHAGYELWTAADGSEAITLLKEKQPDLMICDIRMHEVDGFAVLEAFPKAKRTFPIILLTNFNHAEYRERAAALGADGYFVKTQMTIQSLLDLVEKLLRHKAE